MVINFSWYIKSILDHFVCDILMHENILDVFHESHFFEVYFSQCEIFKLLDFRSYQRATFILGWKLFFSNLSSIFPLLDNYRVRRSFRTFGPLIIYTTSLYIRHYETNHLHRKIIFESFAINQKQFHTFLIKVKNLVKIMNTI